VEVRGLEPLTLCSGPRRSFFSEKLGPAPPHTV